MATSRLRYRADIDGLRAIAIVLVVLFHAFPTHFPGGFIGVDVFFVISGYLITRIVQRGLEQDSFSFLYFYKQRARRLLPALSVVLVAVLAAGWVWLWPQELQQLSVHVVAAAAFVSNIVLWTEAGYFDVATELKPLMHLWSLGIEEQFYLLYPWLLWLGWRLQKRLLGVLLVIVGVSFAASWWQLFRDASGAFFLPWSRFWELTLGGLLAWWQHRHDDALPHHKDGQTRWPNHVLSFSGVLAIGAGMVVLHPGTPYPGWGAWLPAGGSVLLIAAGPQAFVNRVFLTRKPMVLIGLISYPLYLWHWPALSFLHIINADVPSVLHRCLAIAGSVVLAWLTFRLIETPVRFGVFRKRGWVACAAVVVAMAGLSVVVYVRQGVPERLPEQAAAVANHVYDYRAGYREGTCFLRPEQDVSEFGACPDAWSSENAADNWLLWGDSHAAHLYAGLQRHEGLVSNLIQRTASGCPPLAGESVEDRPFCPAIQAHVWTEIENHHPDRVILAARWGLYEWDKLEGTIKRLQAMGIEKIDVVGQVPHWRHSLARQAMIAARKDAFVLPERLSTGLREEVFELDQALKRFVQGLGARYLSAVQSLCNEAGCLIRDAAHPGSLTAWDDAHLTDTGSELLVRGWQGLE